MENRKEFVDYMKAIGIVLVIMGHINFANGAIKGWIYSFHMPLFFFSSGFVLKRTININTLIKKFRKLIIPYFLWALLYSSKDFQPLNILRIVYGSYNTIISAKSLSSLWFLPTLFLSGVMVQLLLIHTKNIWWLLPEGLAMFGLALLLPDFKFGYPWCADVSLITSCFIIFGIVIDRITTKFNTDEKWLLLVGMILQLVSFILKNDSIDYVLLANKRIGDPIAFLVGALGGCLIVLTIARILALKSPKKVFQKVKRCIGYIGRNTLPVFLVHKSIISVCEKAFNEVTLPIYLKLILTTCIVLGFSLLFGILLEKAAPFLFGEIGHALQGKNQEIM